jgi:DedD protein
LQQSTKQRIVGTVVLLALALIFLPIIFDGKGSYQTTISSRIPAAPNVTVLPEPIQLRPVILADSDRPDEPEPTLLPEQDSAQAGEALAPQEAGASALDNEPPAAITVDPVEVALNTITDSTRPGSVLDENGLPQGWSVRLGSFSNADNANALLDRLQEAGYRAYSRIIPVEQGDLTGVFVGPWLDRQTSNGYQQSLQDEFQLAGIVVPYEVEQ